MSPADEASVHLRRLLRDLASDVEAMAQRARDSAEASGEPDGAAANARLAVALHHHYTAFERAIERTLRFFVGDVPAGADRHQTLLLEATRALPEVHPALVSPEALPDWMELLRFRLFFRHAYAAPLDRARIDELTARVRRVQPRAQADFERIVGELEAALRKLEKA